MNRRTGGSEKPRVVRVAQNALISHIITILQEILKLRFESLLVQDDFVMIWSKVVIIRFCNIDIGDLAVYTENKHSWAEIAI